MDAEVVGLGAAREGHGWDFGDGGWCEHGLRCLIVSYKGAEAADTDWHLNLK